MTRQLLKLSCNGIYTVIYNDKEKYNPYVVYRQYRDPQGNKHKHIIAKYADMKSCLYEIANSLF